MRFELPPDNPWRRAQRRSIAFVLLPWLVLSAAWLSNHPGWWFLLFFVIGPLPTIGVVLMIMTGMLDKGYARIDSDGLLVRMGPFTQVYKWKNVTDVRVSTFGQSSWAVRLNAQLMGLDTNRTLVELHLKRMLRIGLFGYRMGTDVFGLPLPTRTVRLFLAKSDDFVEHARQHLNQNVG